MHRHSNERVVCRLTLLQSRWHAIYRFYSFLLFGLGAAAQRLRPSSYILQNINWWKFNTGFLWAADWRCVEWYEPLEMFPTYSNCPVMVSAWMIADRPHCHRSSWMRSHYWMWRFHSGAIADPYRCSMTQTMWLLLEALYLCRFHLHSLRFSHQ